MKDKIQELLNTMYTCWYLHWQYNGKENIQIHLTLDEIYQQLIKFVDEIIETEISVGNNIDMKPTEITIYSSSSLSTLIDKFIDIRNNWKEEIPYELNDLQGRLVTKLNHYIFLLQSKPSTLQLMDTKDDQLIHEMRQLFKSQDEFVTIFNAYLKGKEVPNKIKRFFMKNEDRLTDLSNDILNVNKQLFDEREFYKNRPKSDKNAYNEMVKYFDIFK